LGLSIGLLLHDVELSDFIVSAYGADEAACDDLNLVVEHTFCRRVYCTNFESEFIIYPLVVGVFVVMAILYGKVCRRLKVTSCRAWFLATCADP